MIKQKKKKGVGLRGRGGHIMAGTLGGSVVAGKGFAMILPFDLE